MSEQLYSSRSAANQAAFVPTILEEFEERDSNGSETYGRIYEGTRESIQAFQAAIVPGLWQSAIYRSNGRSNATLTVTWGFDPNHADAATHLQNNEIRYSWFQRSYSREKSILENPLLTPPGRSVTDGALSYKNVTPGQRYLLKELFESNANYRWGDVWNRQGVYPFVAPTLTVEAWFDDAKDDTETTLSVEVCRQIYERYLQYGLTTYETADWFIDRRTIFDQRYVSDSTNGVNPDRIKKELYAFADALDSFDGVKTAQLPSFLTVSGSSFADVSLDLQFPGAGYNTSNGPTGWVRSAKVFQKVRADAVERSDGTVEFNESWAVKDDVEAYVYNKLD